MLALIRFNHYACISTIIFFFFPSFITFDFKNLCVCVCSVVGACVVCECVCACEHTPMDPQTSEEGVEFYEAGVTRGCNPSKVGVGK